MFGLRAKARAYREMERVATNMLNYAEETLEYDSVKTRDIIEIMKLENKVSCCRTS